MRSRLSRTAWLAALVSAITAVVGGPSTALAADAKARLYPDPAEVGQQVQFDASGSNGAFGVQRYDWDFGDATYAQGRNPLHAYTVAGKYVVRLTVTGNLGDKDAITFGVTVNPAPSYFTPFVPPEVSPTVPPVELPRLRLTGLHRHGSRGPNRLAGTSRGDQLFGNGGDDRLIGLGGRDRLVGGTGNDTIWGGDGRDSLDGSDGDDVIYGGPGADVIIEVRFGRDRIYGGPGSDVIKAGRGGDRIYGGDGNDIIFGGSGVDTVYCGRGNDTVYTNLRKERRQRTFGCEHIRIEPTIRRRSCRTGGSRLGELVFGTTASDTCRGRDGDDDVEGGLGNDRLFGGRGNDRLFGRFGRDLLAGGPGDDELEGGRGNDRLLGGSGSDHLNGGYGADYIDCGPGKDTVLASKGDRVRHCEIRR
jgi:Ca2+-binding RTX toxin-like protein